MSAPSHALLGVSPGAAGPVTIIGGGVSGLATAFFLNQGSEHAPEYELLESSERFGGNIRTERWNGFLFDVGPDSFLATRPEAVQLCRELGLEPEMITPSERGRGVYVARDGRLERMPEGLSLGVPMSLGALLDCPSLSPLGKGRALMEPFILPRKDGKEESIGAFMRRRLGREVSERLAAPLLAGVFAGDAEQLSMDAAFPQLVALEQGHGSLLRGMLRGRSWTTLLKSRSSDSPFVTPRAGLERLIGRLVEVLPRDALRSGVRVESLGFDGSGYVIETSEGTSRSAAVILAVPPWAAARLLAGFPKAAPVSEKARETQEALAKELEQIRWSATATVFFAFDEQEVDHLLDASGFIVPEGEGEILAATWISSKWDARAPAGKVLLRAFVGGARAPELLKLSDAELSELGLRELRRFMGRLGGPLWSRVYRYRRGNPQPDLGHRARLARMAGLLAGLPGLYLIGAGYGGVGIPDCVRQAREVARVLLEGPRAR